MVIPGLALAGDGGQRFLGLEFVFPLLIEFRVFVNVHLCACVFFQRVRWLIPPVFLYYYTGSRVVSRVILPVGLPAAVDGIRLYVYIDNRILLAILGLQDQHMTIQEK